MKKSLLFLGLFFIFTLCSFSQTDIFSQFDYYRVYTNYNGSAYNGKAVLAYGEGGVIVRSEDMGKSWQQVNLNDSLNIMSVVNIDDTFYGVTAHNYMLKSEDNGKSWQLINTGKDYYKMLVNSGKLYCIASQSVLVYDKQLNKTGEYAISSDTAYSDFTINGDKLFYSAGHGKIGQINLTNGAQKVTDLSESGTCTDCPVVKSLMTAGNKTLFCLNDEVYSYDGQNAVKFFKRIYTSDNSSGIFCTHNDELYHLYNLYYMPNNLDSLFFEKIGINDGTVQSIKQSGNDRYITLVKLQSFSYLTDDIIMAVGKGKLIYMSYDKGVTWELKSQFNFFDAGNELFMHDRNNAICAGDFVKFTRTTDGGVTWLPQKNYSSNFCLHQFQQLSVYGLPFSKNINTTFLFEDFPLGTINFAVTNDSGNTAFLRNVKDFNNLSYDGGRLAYTDNNLAMLILPSKLKERKYTQFYTLDDSANVMLRTWVDSLHVMFIDKNENSNFCAIAKNYRYPRKTGDDWVYDSANYSYMISPDTCGTWQKVFDFDFNYSKCRINAISKVNDYFLFFINYDSDQNSSQSAIWKLNIKTSQIDSVLSLKNNSISPNGIFNIGKKTFINTRIYQAGKDMIQQLLENDDIEITPDSWKNVMPDYRYQIFISKKNDSLFSISGYDSLMKSYVLWFAKPKQETSVVENAVETQNLLYMTQPMPNPASDCARVRIYWTLGRNIEDADFKVYDLLGNVVSQKEDFEFSFINGYSGELKWKSSSYQAGIYIITFRIDGSIISMPVIKL